MLLPLVNVYELKGFAIWWFAGDRDAAEASYTQRGTLDRSWEAFTAQMNAIELDWARIQEAFGDNLIYTVSAGPAYATPDYIYARMFSRR